jgi:hypothetical protein
MPVGGVFLGRTPAGDKSPGYALRWLKPALREGKVEAGFIRRSP